jgi:hypothetical protein
MELLAGDTEADTEGGADKKDPEEGNEDEPIDNAKAVETELRQFIRWLRKSPSTEFEFYKTPIVYAEVLNKFISVQDYDSARWYAERYLA